MNLTDLKQKPAAELIALADELGLEGVARSRKQDVIFGILKAQAKKKAKTSPATACWKSFKTDLASSARETAHT